MAPFDAPIQAGLPLGLPAAASGDLSRRFLALGRDAHADAETLRFLLAPFHDAGEARSLADRLLGTYRTVPRILSLPVWRLEAVPGLAPAAAAALGLFHLLAIERARSRLPARIDPLGPGYDRVVEYLRAAIGHGDMEQFHVLFLDRDRSLISAESQSRGTINHAPAYPRELCRRALELEASAVLLAHNHPSGDPSPSTADRTTTQRIAAACTMLGIRVDDHLIVSASDHFAFREADLL